MNKKFTTISISEETKKKLESEKGDMSWDDFLLLLINEYRKKKVEKGIGELRSLLTGEDIEKIEESHKKMHEMFEL
jgi:predicted CopG family antitoxin